LARAKPAAAGERPTGVASKIFLKIGKLYEKELHQIFKQVENSSDSLINTEYRGG